MSQPAVQINNLRFSWPNGAAVLNIPALTIKAGTHLFLMGESGSGKSTLLGIIAGIHDVGSGEAQILGHPFHAINPSARDQVRASAMGVIFQQFNLVPYLSLVENVLLPLQFSKTRATRVGATQAERTQKAEALLARLGLGNELGQQKTAAELSVGQQQRVAAARALIGAPSLIIADEPTSALDAKARGAFIELLLGEAKDAAVLFVSHDQSLAANFNSQLTMDEINDLRPQQNQPTRPIADCDPADMKGIG